MANAVDNYGALDEDMKLGSSVSFASRGYIEQNHVHAKFGQWRGFEKMSLLLCTGSFLWKIFNSIRHL